MKTASHQLVLCLVVTLVLLAMGCPLNAQPANGGKLYVLMISGGRNRLTNHERYWNDCAFLYRTLRHRYLIPKEQFTVLVSDGFDPAADMVRADGMGLLSSPTDLDGDGWPDVTDAATPEMLTLAIYRMARQLTEKDHLFLFFTDHGGTADGQSDSNLWLWGDASLADYQLGLLLELLHAGRLVILMGQCNSGGFIDNLQHDGRVVMTACAGDETSWRCPDRDYDEFLYQWTCAVNGADEYGNPVNADTNGDDTVSMEEAFSYARSHDRTPETPQYVSWPMSLGSQWSFGSLHTSAIRQLEATEDTDGEWSLSGVRQPHEGHGLHIVRQGGRIRKVVR